MKNIEVIAFFFILRMICDENINYAKQKLETLG